LEKLKSVKEKVCFIICGLGYLEVEPVYMDYHPAEDLERLPEIRARRSRYRI
jgi:hypothetical protein